MRKFNFDEFIWFIIQIALLLTMFFLVQSNIINSFINEKMMIYLYISMVILVVYILGQLFKIISIPSRVYVTNKFFPITSVIILTISFFYLIPNYIIVTNGNLETNIDLIESNIIKIDQSNFKVLYEDEINNMEGETIEFAGIIKSIDDNYTILYREIVSCCQNDKFKLEVMIAGCDFTEDDIGSFAKVTGNIIVGEKTYINAVSEEITEQPLNLFFHE